MSHKRRIVLGRTIAVALILGLLLVGELLAQDFQVAKKLQTAWPEVFSADTVADAAELGELGARVVAVNAKLTSLGFQRGDFILAVEGKSLSSPNRIVQSNIAEVVFTVYRRVTQQRLIVPLTVVAVRVLEQFDQLPAAQQSPARLARMLANQKTLMDHGVGVLLLPKTVRQDDRQWLRVANPLPRSSEDAVRAIQEAFGTRVRISARSDELQASRESLAAGKYVEASERVRRAMLQRVVNPEHREDSDQPQQRNMTDFVTTYRQVERQLSVQRHEFLAPSPFFGIVAEGAFTRLQSFLPQDTMLQTENSTGVDFSVGFRMRIISKTDFIVQYGQTQNSFENEDGIEQIHTTVNSVRFEIAYRPSVLSRLTPMLRVGVGLFYLDADVINESETALSVKAKDFAVGTILGGGVDAFYWRTAKLRGTLGATFRILRFQMTEAKIASQNPTLNIPVDFDSPWTNHLPPGNQVRLVDSVFKLDMNSWQVAFLLSRDF